MITKISILPNSPETNKTNFNSTKKGPARILNESVKDNVHLSAQSIQKAAAESEHLHKTTEFSGYNAFIDDQQQDNFEKLIADLIAMKEKSDITEQQKEILKNNLKSTLQGAHKPDQAAIDNFVDDISEIISDGHLDYREIKTIQEDIHLLLNSANISDEEIEVLKEDFQTIVESSNLSQEDWETLRDDIDQIIETARKDSNL